MKNGDNKKSRIEIARAVLIKQDTGNIQGSELVYMRNKRMEKLLSKVQKSGVVNYTRTYWSSYVSKQSWA